MKQPSTSSDKNKDHSSTHSSTEETGENSPEINVVDENIRSLQHVSTKETGKTSPDRNVVVESSQSTPCVSVSLSHDPSGKPIEAIDLESKQQASHKGNKNEPKAINFQDQNKKQISKRKLKVTGLSRISFMFEQRQSLKNSSDVVEESDVRESKLKASLKKMVSLNLKDFFDNIEHERCDIVEVSGHNSVSTLGDESSEIGKKSTLVLFRKVINPWVITYICIIIILSTVLIVLVINANKSNSSSSKNEEPNKSAAQAQYNLEEETSFVTSIEIVQACIEGSTDTPKTCQEYCKSKLCCFEEFSCETMLTDAQCITYTACYNWLLNIYNIPLTDRLGD